MSLKDTRKKGTRTLISIAVIAIAVYIGFEPLIANVPEGVAQSVISSAFGAIFVIILTMYLLNKQTEIEQESKKVKEFLMKKSNCLERSWIYLETCCWMDKFQKKKLTDFHFH